jgi:hypothetical protein
LSRVKENLLGIAENLERHDYKGALELCRLWGDETANILLGVVEELALEQETRPAGIYLAVFFYRNYEITATAYSEKAALEILKKELDELRVNRPELELEDFATLLEWESVTVHELPLNTATWL